MGVFITEWVNGATTWDAASLNPNIVALDTLAAVKQNMIISCDGSVTYNKSTGTLSWSSTLRIIFNDSSGNSIHNTIAAGSVVLTDGQFAYADLTATNGATANINAGTITLAAVSTIKNTLRVVLGYRNAASDDFYPVALTPAFGASGKQGKYDATVAPTASNDVTQGYEVGSPWINVTDDEVYTCVDNTEDAAIWKLLSSSGGHTIQSSGVSKTDRAKLNFIGFDVRDDSTNDATNVIAYGNMSGAVEVVIGANKSDFTPSVSGTSNVTWTGKKWRTGNILHMDIQGDLTGNLTGQPVITLPDSLNADMSIFDTGNTATVGHGLLKEIGTAYYPIVGNLAGATAISLMHPRKNTSDVVDHITLTGSTPSTTLASGDIITLHVAVPIDGWDTTQQLEIGIVPAMFSAKAAYSKSLAGSGGEQLDLISTAFEDLSGMIDTTNNRLYVPINCDRAVVMIDGKITPAATNTAIYTAFYRNGSEVAVANRGSSTYTGMTETSGVFNVSGGDYFHVTVNTPSNAVTIAGEVSIICWNSTAPAALQMAREDITSAATINIDVGSANILDLTLDQSATINFSNGVDGQRYVLRVRQDGAGSKVATWGTMCRDGSDLSWPTLSTAGDALDYIVFMYNLADDTFDIISANTGF